MQLFGCDQRETLGEVEAQLPAEYAARAGAGAIGFARALFEHMMQQVEVLLHYFSTLTLTLSRRWERG